MARQTFKDDLGFTNVGKTTPRKTNNVEKGEVIVLLKVIFNQGDLIV